MSTSLTDKDRVRLERLLKAQKRLAIAFVKQRSAQLKADFEQKLAAIYSPLDSEAWRKAEEAAEAAIRQANDQIAAESARLGIPARFGPKVTISWWSSGENAVAGRRAELRKVADAMIARSERTAALTAVEQKALQTETELLTGALSDEARSFLEERMPVERLMPTFEVKEAEALLPLSRWEVD